MDHLDALLQNLPRGQYAFERDDNGAIVAVLIAPEVDEETFLLGAKPYIGEINPDKLAA